MILQRRSDANFCVAVQAGFRSGSLRSIDLAIPQEYAAPAINAYDR